MIWCVCVYVMYVVKMCLLQNIFTLLCAFFSIMFFFKLSLVAYGVITVIYPHGEWLALFLWLSKNTTFISDIFRGSGLRCVTDTKHNMLLSKFPFRTIQSILSSPFVYRLRHDSSSQPLQHLQNICPVLITVVQELMSWPPLNITGCYCNSLLHPLRMFSFVDYGTTIYAPSQN